MGADAFMLAKAPAPLAFSDAISSRRYADMLARDGHVQIPNVLTKESAAALAAALRQDTPWGRSISVNNEGREVPVAQFESHSRESQQQLLQIVWKGARDGFQYLFDRYRFWDLAKAGEPVPPMLAAADTLLNAPQSIGAFRALTGNRDITFVDAQATRYLPGHFLAMHDDDRVDIGRRYAYVLNLSERWRGDWGGLLLFHDGDRVSGGLLPLYNTLNVFKVPRMHSVSMVAPYAGAPRLAITGWMRAGTP